MERRTRLSAVFPLGGAKALVAQKSYEKGKILLRGGGGISLSSTGGGTQGGEESGLQGERWVFR